MSPPLKKFLLHVMKMKEFLDAATLHDAVEALDILDDEQLANVCEVPSIGLKNELLDEITEVELERPEFDEGWICEVLGLGPVADMNEILDPKRILGKAEREILRLP